MRSLASQKTGKKSLEEFLKEYRETTLAEYLEKFQEDFLEDSLETFRLG